MKKHYYHNLISYRTTFVLVSLPHMQRFRFIYSSEVMSRLRLVWAHLSSLDMWMITWASFPFCAAISWFKWMLFFSPRKNELEYYFAIVLLVVTNVLHAPKRVVPIIVVSGRRKWWTKYLRLLFTLLINPFVSFSLVYGLGSMIGCCEVEVTMSLDHAVSRTPCNCAFFHYPTPSLWSF